MSRNLVWTIGCLDDFKDTFRNPDAVSINRWKVENKIVKGTEKWPSFHASNADPDGQYRLRPYTIEFEMEEAKDCIFELKIIVSQPRIPYIEIDVNGVKGNIFLNPIPSTIGEIKPKHALHTTIYNMETIEVSIPKKYFNSGTNIFTITALDYNEVIEITNLQAVLRLDRMADACGFTYEGACLYEISEDEKPARIFEIKPSVVYKKDEKYSLVERCHGLLKSEGELESFNAQLVLSFDGKTLQEQLELKKITFGHYIFDFWIPDGEDEVNYQLKGDIDASGIFKRRRKWKVFTTPHAHTDIGYTHRQWEVSERLSRNIDIALDTLRSEREAFTYILDSSWALEEYLNTRDNKRKEEVLQAVKDGKLGVPSNYVDLLTQFASLEDLIRNGEFSESVLREIGVIPDRMDIVDVASATSSLPSILKGSGVKYLLHANNQDRGPFRLNGGMNKVSPFYWEGPDGEKILVWLAKMYCELKKVCGSPPSISAAETGLQMWLDEYERENYKPDAVVLYGQEADNTDLDPRVIDFIKKWNETYEYPKLIPSNGSSFFEYVEESFGDSFITVKGDEGAYWEDGVASSIIESIKVRDAQAKLKAAESLEALAVINNAGWKYPGEYFDEGWKQVLLYDEHTWGAFLSGSDPEAVLQKDQWSVKANMAVQAHHWGNRLLHNAMVRHSLNWNNNGREVVVYNPNSWTISGTVRVEIGKSERVYDTAGTEIPLKILNLTESQAYVELWIDDLEGFGYRRCFLKEEDKLEKNSLEDSGTYFSVENKYYKLNFDMLKGAILSLYDKELAKELVNEEDKFEMFQFLYATGGDGSKLLGNHADKSRETATLLQKFRYNGHNIERHGFGTSVKVRGEVPYGILQIEYTLYDTAKKLEIAFNYEKKENINPEAVYISFPFKFKEDAEILSDSQIGWVNWDKESMPGACKEWLPLQTSILVSGDDADIQIASPDAFLFTVNDEVKGRWPKVLKLSGSRIFSYVLNNYWRSNYKGLQGGNISFRYVVTSREKINKAEAYKFGWEARLGLCGHRMSYQEFRETKPLYSRESGNSFARIGSENIVVSTIKAARYEEGFIIRLQEIEGKAGEAIISFNIRKIQKAYITDHLERIKRKINTESDTLRVEMKPWEVKSIRVII